MLWIIVIKIYRNEEFLLSQEINSQRAIEKYIPLVQFLGAFLGDRCEVVLHDAIVKEKSVLAITNGHISGRNIGAPLTDLALKLVQSEKYKESKWVMGYTTQAKDGTPLHSATYFIQDTDGTLLGMLCLNMAVSELLEAKKLLSQFIKATGLEDSVAKYEETNTETFTDNIEELTEGIICNVIEHSEVSPERMTTSEKMKIMGILNDRGVFLLKGAVALVAEKLVASEATIYRYLQKLE